jgi:hypothetical protein
MPGMPEPRVRHSREHVVERTIREFDELDALIGRLGPEDWDRRVPRPETRDPWTVKDAIVHVLFWKAHAARVCRRQPPPDDERGLEVNQLNHLIYQRWRGRPVADVVAWHRQVQEEALAALAAAPDSWFDARERSATWPEDLDGHSASHRRKDVEAVLQT